MTITEQPLREQLEAKRKTIKRRVNQIGDHLRQQHGPLDPNFSEQAQELENDQILAHLDEAGRLELAQINRALKAMDDGEYGICEDCGREIGERRLHALPYAQYCIKCAEKRES